MNRTGRLPNQTYSQTASYTLLLSSCL